MSEKIKKIFALCFSVVFVSCGNAFFDNGNGFDKDRADGNTPANSVKYGTVTGHAGLTGATPDEVFSVLENDAKKNSTYKSAFPSFEKINGDSNVTKKILVKDSAGHIMSGPEFVYSNLGEGGAVDPYNGTFTITGIPCDTSFTILVQFTIDIQIGGEAKTQVLLEGETETLTLPSENPILMLDKKIDLLPKQTQNGFGNVELLIDLSDFDDDFISDLGCWFSDATSEHPFKGEIDCDNKVAKITAANNYLSAKAYTASFYFFSNSDDSVLYCFTDVINVYDGLTTDRWVVSGDHDGLLQWDAAAGKYVAKLTPELIKEFETTTYYVRDGSDGRDKCDGNFYSPFKSLESAISKVNKSDASKTYTIFVKTSEEESERYKEMICDNVVDPDDDKKALIKVNLNIIPYVKVPGDQKGKIELIADASLSTPAYILKTASGKKCTFTNIIFNGNGKSFSYGELYAESGATVCNGCEFINSISSAVCVNNSTYYLNDCVIKGNGSAVYVTNNGTLNLIRCDFIGNSTTGNGGALNNRGTCFIKDCNFWGNTASLGGAIYNDTGAKLEFAGKVVIGDENATSVTASDKSNRAQQGAGIYLRSQFTVRSSASLIISNNIADDGSNGFGGGICFDTVGSSANPFVMSNVTVKYCSAKLNGAGLYVVDSCVEMRDSEITGCSTAEGNGGGVYSTSSSIVHKGQFTLSSGKIHGCSARNGGGVQSDCFYMRGGKITGCTSTDTNGWGGGICIESTIEKACEISGGVIGGIGDEKNTADNGNDIAGLSGYDGEISYISFTGGVCRSEGDSVYTDSSTGIPNFLQMSGTARVENGVIRLSETTTGVRIAGDITLPESGVIATIKPVDYTNDAQRLFDTNSGEYIKKYYNNFKIADENNGYSWALDSDGKTIPVYYVKSAGDDSESNSGRVKSSPRATVSAVLTGMGSNYSKAKIYLDGYITELVSIPNGKTITIEGMNYASANPADDVLDGIQGKTQNNIVGGIKAVSIISVASGANLTLRGVKVFGNNFTASTGGFQGAGIKNEGTLVLDKCLVSDNICTRQPAYTCGGGIYQKGSAPIITIRDTVIKGNTAKFGGGIYFEECSQSNITFEGNNIIEGNTGMENGGGIYLENTDIDFSSGVIRNNTANSSGSGVYLADESCNLTFSKSGYVAAGNDVYFVNAKSNINPAYSKINIPAADAIDLPDEANGVIAYITIDGISRAASKDITFISIANQSDSRLTGWFPVIDDVSDKDYQIDETGKVVIKSNP